ncbi:enoyl-CoA hydratase/isomerase family protein [Pseudomonas silesiensis]|uniref:enoyl-CoA hydratase/isomerase family protein n=1 Tax=Pseudomonas silesiensis TaxID=1853130 RepID=UPI0030DAC465
MSSPVQWSREGAIAVVCINNPPVNALGHSVRAGLLAAFNAVERDPGIKLVLLYCAGRTFIAGADIREFGKPPQAPILPDVTLSLENFTKPSLAVLHGSVLGGGLEVALACHYRIIEVNAKVGLPEVKLGLLPGAGGTQRLPRLAGVAKALEMIVGGEPISAVEAKRHAIVDEVYEGEPLAAGLAYAAQLLAQGVQPRRSGHASIPAGVGSTAELLMAKRDEVQRSQPESFSPVRCIAAIEAAIALPLSEGLQRERTLFLECMASPQREALIQAFFAQRQAAKAVGPDAAVTPCKPPASRQERLAAESKTVAELDQQG